MSTTYKVLLSVLFIHSVFSFSLQTVTDPNLYLVKVTDPDALCLDGSPAAYYVSKDGDPKKIYLQFEGGGWCTGYDSINQTLDDCLSRTKTGQGSSTSYAPSYQFNDGVLSVNSQNNFKDWTRVLLKYCDGSGHQGTRKNPIPYKGTNLYFRGHNVTVGQLNTLERQNKLFSEATHVVVGGDSAGGLAVFLWTNYIKERVKVGKVWAIPDSGIFLDSVHSMTKQPEYKNMFKNLISITDLQIAPPVPECAQKFKDSLQNCMFATNLAPYIKAPMFIIQSLYDTWSIQNILGINCVYDGSLAYCNWDQKTKIHDYHKNTTNAIIDMVYKNPNINGFFAPVCANHVYDTMGSYYSPLFRIPANSQNSIVKGVQSWMEESKDITTYQLIDLGQWPNNRPCAGQVTPWI